MTYVWPETLAAPIRPPKLVYLDLNHWIALAKALSGHRDGDQYKEALAACADAADRGLALFPISDSIYIEISKIGRYRQRRNLREVIERVSGFMVVTSRSLVSAHEIEAILNRQVGPNPRVVNTMSYIDWGVARAFGMVGGFKFIDEETGDDVTGQARSRYPGGPEAFDRFFFEQERELNRRTLDGPSPDEEPEMRRLDGTREAHSKSQNAGRPRRSSRLPGSTLIRLGAEDAFATLWLRASSSSRSTSSSTEVYPSAEACL
jgi:hypothetical protein